MPNLPSKDDLDTLVEELFSSLGTKRTGDDFHFDPDNITGATRGYYTDFLDWLGIDAGVLDAERICIHDDRDRPANLERRRVGDSGEGYTLYLDNGLYRSLDAVYAALAHQVTHLKLIIAEEQSLAEATTCEPVELTSAKKSAAEKKDDDTDDDDADDVAVDKEQALADLEIRTEVAAFVLGFGKLLLNGAAEWDELEVDAADGFERITTLPVESLAHLHKATARHADVGSKAIEAGLTDAAKTALGKIKKK